MVRDYSKRLLSDPAAVQRESYSPGLASFSHGGHEASDRHKTDAVSDLKLRYFC